MIVTFYEIGGTCRDLGVGVLSGTIVAALVLNVMQYFYFAAIGAAFMILGIWLQQKFIKQKDKVYK